MDYKEERNFELFLIKTIGDSGDNSIAEIVYYVRDLMEKKMHNLHKEYRDQRQKDWEEEMLKPPYL